MKFILLPNGDIEAVYDDQLARLNLGKISQVQRASHVEFNVALQVWEAIDLDGRVLCRHPLRNKCVALERDLVHQQLVAQHRTPLCP